MKPIYTIMLLAATMALAATLMAKENTDKKSDRLLRHVVAFKFKSSASKADIQKVVDAFSALPDKIKEIKKFEWGINNSPEGLNKGCTHGFILNFHSEKDRNTYLVHPDHKAFGSLLGPHLEDVFVIDFWAKN